MKAKPTLSVGTRFYMAGGSAAPLPPTVQAAASEKSTDDDAGPVLGQRFNIVAYGGGPIAQYWSEIPLVIDISASTVAAVFPILQHHSTFRIIGHATDAVTTPRVFALDCVVSVPGAASTEFVLAARAGFPWRASVGASVTSRRELKAGEKAKVNGRDFVGPLVIVGAHFFETSILPLPADDETGVSLIA
jgi:hypothetical protein